MREPEGFDHESRGGPLARAHWLKKYHGGELSLDLYREEQLVVSIANRALPEPFHPPTAATFSTGAASET